MNRRTANLVVVALVLVGTLLFLTDRYVFAARSVQRSIFGEPITGLREMPTYHYDRGFGPWVESWTYSLRDPIPSQLQAKFGCRIGAEGVACSRCQSKLLGMCFLGERTLSSGEYRVARIIDGKFRVERGVADGDQTLQVSELQLCLPDSGQLAAFAREMRLIAQSENMQFSDRGESAKRDFDAIDPTGRSHDLRQPVIEIALQRPNGMGLVAGNLALPPDRMVITFSKGNSGTESEEFAKRVTARIQPRWACRKGR